MPDFSLHSQLAKDTILLGDLPLCRALLMNDKRYPWLILVPRREDLKEIVDLLPGDQTQLMAEITKVSHALQAAYNPDKLNVAALGNMVPQLHIHIIARFKNDEAWPRPVWGLGAAQTYPDSEIEGVKQKLAAIF